MSEKRIIAADSQRLDAICACPRLYSFRFGTPEMPTGWAPNDAPAYREKGSLQHIMLETYYTLRKYRYRWALNKRTHADIVQICINVGRTMAIKMQLDLTEVEIGVETFKQYAEYWQNDGWDNILAVEEVGSKILYEDDEVIILYEVKMDLVLKLQNTILPVDHKTTKSHRDPNELANQFKGYCWFMGVNNMMVNEIGFQRTYEPSKKFLRHVLSYPQDLIDEWREQAIYWILQADAHERMNHFPPNYTSCDKYSGCDYKLVCSSDRSVRDRKLRTHFSEQTWDVGQILSATGKEE